jgi:hypothetical protein
MAVGAAETIPSSPLESEEGVLEWETPFTVVEVFVVVVAVDSTAAAAVVDFTEEEAADFTAVVAVADSTVVVVLVDMADSDFTNVFNNENKSCWNDCQGFESFNSAFMLS